MNNIMLMGAKEPGMFMALENVSRTDMKNIAYIATKPNIFGINSTKQTLFHIWEDDIQTE